MPKRVRASFSASVLLFAPFTRLTYSKLVFIRLRFNGALVESATISDLIVITVAELGICVQKAGYM